MEGDHADVPEKLRRQVERLSVSIEKMKLAEYVDLLHNPLRLLWINFISGIARGLEKVWKAFFNMAVFFARLGNG